MIIFYLFLEKLATNKFNYEFAVMKQNERNKYKFNEYLDMLEKNGITKEMYYQLDKELSNLINFFILRTLIKRTKWLWLFINLIVKNWWNKRKRYLRFIVKIRNLKERYWFFRR